MANIIKVIKSLEDLGVLTDGVTETVKYEIKRQSEFLDAVLAPLAAWLVQPVIYCVVKGITRRVVRKSGREHNTKF